ncbi:twin transmembrane helix small protein [Delftia sp. PS-11]|uniref:twin transmembrane helix small protein n=1 Tax=Delftia sp. PS-11 TaxID=2767222 RepID=UPI00245902EB|nr:twin transmembrane helix small protein [Delftia sp. PS-11]KAJ8746529.1 twin transmembrane helix small protein [Delftia sp. PS-11]
MKFVIVLALLAIVASLGSALFFMMRRPPEGQDDALDDRRRSRAMFRSLALRVGLSVTLFLCVLLAAKLGYIHPTGWTAGR